MNHAISGKILVKEVSMKRSVLFHPGGHLHFLVVFLFEMVFIFEVVFVFDVVLIFMVVLLFEVIFIS